MVRVWGRVIKKDKIVKSDTIDVDAHECTFFNMLRSLCEKLDIPTPVLLEKHVNDFNRFNMSVFKPADFIQPVNFSSFVISNVTMDE